MTVGELRQHLEEIDQEQELYCQTEDGAGVYEIPDAGDHILVLRKVPEERAKKLDLLPESGLHMESEARDFWSNMLKEASRRL